MHFHGNYFIIGKRYSCHFSNYVLWLCIIWPHLEAVYVSLMYFISLVVVIVIVTVILVTSWNDVGWLEFKQNVNQKTTTDVWPEENHNEFSDSENKLFLQNALNYFTFLNFLIDIHSLFFRVYLINFVGLFDCWCSNGLYQEEETAKQKAF